MHFLPLTAVLLSTLALVHSAAIHHPRSPDNSGSDQTIPSTPPTKFNNGASMLFAEPPQDTTTPTPPIYGPREIDLPFYRLFHGSLTFFPTGQLNTPAKDTDTPLNAGGVDNANQSACGIPDNAFFISKVAIHPYFLKYAPLSRFCEQDVCIAFWKNDGSSDMMLKVTDICSTDPTDPTYCATPQDIKIDRTKASIINHLSSPPTGDSYPDPVWWFFTSCWDDGLVQPPYTDNWFAQPSLPNNLQWAQGKAMQQYQNNQKAYPAKGWETYPNGGYNTTRVAQPISDWVKGEEPCYVPIAGGKGWGSNICGEGGGNKSSSAAGGGGLVAASSSVAAGGATLVGSSMPVASVTAPSSNTAAAAAVVPANSATSTAAAESQDEEEQDECEL